MSARREVFRFAPGLGTFSCGLAILIAATILNLALDELEVREIALLPAGLVVLYETTGKIGVTLLLVTLGLAVILFGCIFRRPQPRTGEARTASQPPLTSLHPSVYEGTTSTSTSGMVVLQTAKYLPRQRRPSGTTGTPSARTPA